MEHPMPSRQQLTDIMAEADLRVLLIVLFQWTGDERWLHAPFTPRRDVRLIADEDAGLPPEVQAEIRAAAVDLLAQGMPEPALPCPDEALMLRLMRHCLAEEVPPEYAPTMLEQLGFDPLEQQVPRPGAGSDPARMPVLIVGAGVSGIVLGRLLLARGIPFRIIDKNPQAGGTWTENRYPGCGVDTPNHAYSYSFGPRYAWSQYFSPQGEILDYLLQMAENSGLVPYMQFDTEVLSADWDASASRWRVRVRVVGGEELLEAAVLVSAVGQLNLPLVPELPGATDFRGPLFHSSQWPAGLDLGGKRVALVGTGASAMQIAPSICEEVASLTIYQRSPQWARPIPRYHDRLGEGAQWLLQNLPLYAAWFRFAMFWRYGDGLLPFLRKDPDWKHPERSMNRINERHRLEMVSHIHERLGDREDLLAHCVPDYPPYGKRILLDNGWYDTLRRDNVELVPRAVSEVREDGLLCAQGEFREADVVVLATGFQVGKMAARLNISGRDGLQLSELWAQDNPTAYLGISVAGFPNLFCMLGPSTGLGHGGSAMFQSECQARYITACIVEMLERGADSMEPESAVQEDFVRRVDAEHAQMIWTHPTLSTYYRNPLGRVFSLLPWRLVDYWHMTRDVNPGDYRFG